MYRLALASLLALALIEVTTACPPAQPQVTIVDGKPIVEWFCPPGKVMFMHDNINRCFDRCASCPNGFCHANQCHCFPGTQPAGPGVCGKICPNCENGWCSSSFKCECFDGFVKMFGKCISVAAAIPKPENTCTSCHPPPCGLGLNMGCFQELEHLNDLKKISKRQLNLKNSSHVLFPELHPQLKTNSFKSQGASPQKPSSLSQMFPELHPQLKTNSFKSQGASPQKPSPLSQMFPELHPQLKTNSFKSQEASPQKPPSLSQEDRYNEKACNSEQVWNPEVGTCVPNKHANRMDTDMSPIY